MNVVTRDMKVRKRESGKDTSDEVNLFFWTGNRVHLILVFPFSRFLTFPLSRLQIISTHFRDEPIILPQRPGQKHLPENTGWGIDV